MASIAGKWQKFSLNQQMANIGSEVSRALTLRQMGAGENTKNSVFRILELIDLTIEDKRWRGRLSEIFRLREVICDFFIGDNVYNTTPVVFKNYFLFFALNIKTVQ